MGWTLPALVRQTLGRVGPPEAAQRGSEGVIARGGLRTKIGLSKLKVGAEEKFCAIS